MPTTTTIKTYVVCIVGYIASDIHEISYQSVKVKQSKWE